jgi:hypothetical protein
MLGRKNKVLELQNVERTSKQAIKQEKAQPPRPKKKFQNWFDQPHNKPNKYYWTHNLKPGVFLGQRRSMCHKCIAPAERREKLVVEMMIWEIGWQ